jgi:two-component system OmpR family sensor kinase
MMRRRPRRLQRQLFSWLALTILATGFVVFGVLRLLQHDLPFETRVRQVSAFAAGQFAERWASPPAREALAREVAEAFGATIWLVDAEGTELYRTGPDDCRGAAARLDVPGPSGRLGSVRACLRGYRHTGALTGLLVLFSAGGVLWTAAALVARRLTRPLLLLIDTTREIGAGNLSARVRLGRHQGGEVGLLADSVNEMARRIERQLKDQRELLAVVSHEVRSPLARLRICAELLRGNPGDQKALGALEREVDDIDVLVGKLLANSRLDFDTLTKKLVLPSELWGELLERRKLGQEIVDDRSGGLKVEVDATLIARALDNLLDNAARHAGGATRCVLRRMDARGSDPATLVFEVWDAGPGFDPRALPRVFEAFFRGEGQARAEPGQLGLGLALVRRIAAAHGGRAWAENLPEGGARVSFSVAVPNESLRRSELTTERA